MECINDCKGEAKLQYKEKNGVEWILCDGCWIDMLKFGIDQWQSQGNVKKANELKEMIDGIRI